MELVEEMRVGTCSVDQMAQVDFPRPTDDRETAARRRMEMDGREMRLWCVDSGAWTMRPGSHLAHADN